MLRSRVVLFVLLTLATSGLLEPARATDVSGIITSTIGVPIDIAPGDTITHWTKAGSPYHVKGTVTIPAYNTLSIEPGVDVLFDADVQFVVQGSLYARGTKADSIRFLKGTAGSWRGIRISGGWTSTLEYVRISGGYARGSEPDCRGGGLYVSGVGTWVDIHHSAIVGNRAAQDGGGIANEAGEMGGVYMTHCRVSDNSAEGEWGVGGGISSSGWMQMYYCVISGNTTSGTGSGGAVFNVGSGPLFGCVMYGCVIYGNAAGNAGGAINNAGNGSLTLYECTISSNTAPHASAINNSASASAELLNTIVWANTPAEQIVSNSGTVTATYSDIQGGFEGTGNISADPLFVDAANGDYSLRPDSPCIDTGSPSTPLDPDGTRTDISAIAYSHPVGVVEQQGLPSFSLMQNAPNPFNPSTTIRFTLPEAGHVTLAVYDINGRLVRTLVGQAFLPGHHEVVWDGKDAMGRAVASGVYVYRLTAPQGVVTKRMTLLR